MNNNNTPKRKLQAIPKINIDPGAIVNFTRLGSRHGEVIWMAKEPTPGIIKINKDEYIVIKTGEKKRFKQNEGKVVDYLRKVFRNLEHLIKTNFDTEENAHNALFITLTYAENMMDSDRLYKDYDIFLKKLKYAYKDIKFDYIAVAEPQERGAWHMHVLLKSDKPVLFIDNKKLSDIWGHGFTETERIKGKDPGKYFAAYFTALESEGKEDPNAVYVKAANGKKYKKGARLHFYPKGMKFYRCSRGISRPEKESKIYDTVTREYGKPKKTDTFELHEVRPDEGSEDGASAKTLNTIQREEFQKIKI